ncbi:MAG: hypothetical protein LQ346_004827 [Caloplaca aetnensis]|nr:MAG: hypothetical protein LQ346_004827 [Caloplaca aetnensis]
MSSSAQTPKVPEPIHGSCLCGAFRYQLRGGLGKPVICYCSSCQMTSGGFFEADSVVDEKNFTIDRSDGHAEVIKEYTRSTDSGVPVSRFFCSVCGCTVYTKNDEHAPEMVIVAAGTMKGGVEGWWKPEMELYCERKPEWLAVEGVARSERMERDVER